MRLGNNHRDHVFCVFIYYIALMVMGLAHTKSTQNAQVILKQNVGHQYFLTF